MTRRFDWYADDMREAPYGLWVSYEDFLTLSKEVERLRASSFVTAVPVEQYQRVIKAGDAMASSIQFSEEMAKDYNGSTIVRQCVKVWRASKEGGGYE